MVKSVSEAMVSGVPMLVIPFVSDQPVNAGQVARLGLGMVLEYKYITAERLKEAAFAVLNDEHIRENQRKIPSEMARAPSNAGAVGIVEAYYKLEEHCL